MMFPDVGIVLSTRETPKLRDGLIPLGVTMMSAGSAHRTGRLHRRGQGKHPSDRARQNCGTGVRRERMGAAAKAIRRTRRDNSTSPTSVPPDEVADLIRKLGYEPVWKDWDAALTA